MNLISKLKDHSHRCPGCGRLAACPSDCNGESTNQICESCGSGLPINVGMLEVASGPDPRLQSEPTRKPNCLICGKELGSGEIQLNRAWHFDCQRCNACGHEMPNIGIIEKCLNENRPVEHDACYKTRLFSEWKNKVLPLRHEHLDALNEEICGFYPAVNPDSADISALYDIIRKLELCATNVNWALQLTKDKLQIINKDQFNYQQAQKRKAEAAARIETEKERLDAQARTEQLKAERENPQLRTKRKALESIMKTFGFTQEQAEAWLLKSAPAAPTPTGENN